MANNASKDTDVLVTSSGKDPSGGKAINREYQDSETCSPGSYGRTVYIKNHGVLRFHPRIPRDSGEFKKIYNERIAC